MTRKQYNLVHNRMDVVFSIDLKMRERITRFAEDIVDQDVFGSNVIPKKLVPKEDQSSFISAIVNAEKYRHARVILHSDAAGTEEQKEKNKILTILERYGY